MDFDKERALTAKKSFQSIVILSLMGGVGIVLPVLSIFVATFKGVTELSLFNSAMLMVLAILVMLFVLIRSATAYLANDPKLFSFGIVFIVADLISLIYSLMTYLVL